MEKIHHFTPDKKLKWFGYGEWVEEPDEVRFIHDGFTCRVVRVIKYEPGDHVFGGHFCGYIWIPQDHPWYAENWDKIDTTVHGGITWAGTGVFDDNTDFWVGFDCAHSGDIVPSLSELMLDMIEKDQLNLFEPSYKNISYAVGETQDLATQAKSVQNIKDSVMNIYQKD